MELQVPESPHFRNLVAIALGLTVSLIVVGSVEMVGYSLYPPPAHLDLDDPEDVRQLMAEASVPALLFSLAAWALGIGAGCFVAGILGGTEQGSFSALVTGLTHAALAVMILLATPAPTWFSFTGILILIPGGWTGWQTANRLHQRWQLQRDEESLNQEY